MKALITGTPGWMGSKLAFKLLENNIEVRCLVLPNINYDSLKKHNIEIVCGDITNQDSLKEACKNISIVFHCAGMIHPRNSKLFYDINFYGTKNLATEAIKNNVEKFIYVSSNAASNANNFYKSLNEDDLPMPFMDYGLSKLKAECLLNNYYTEGKIKIVIIRPNWLYGENGPPRQNSFIKMIKEKNCLIFGDGSTYRSLCEINNCIEALYLAGTNENIHGKTFYIADDKPYNIMDIYQTFCKLLSIEFNPHKITIPSSNSLSYKFIDRIMQGVRFYKPEIHMAWEWSKNVEFSIDKAKLHLGYKPIYNLETGMKKALVLNIT